MVDARDVDALPRPSITTTRQRRRSTGLTRALQADRALAEALRARVSPWTAQFLDRWLARTLHDDAVKTQRDFLALATRLAASTRRSGL
ncbi:MAG: hypothetical protein U0326_19365 [Polyangiales bacterium]